MVFATPPHLTLPEAYESLRSPARPPTQTSAHTSAPTLPHLYSHPPTHPPIPTSPAQHAPTPLHPPQQALEAVTRISKSFPVKLVTEARPELGALLVGACPRALVRLPAARRCPRALARCRAGRGGAGRGGAGRGGAGRAALRASPSARFPELSRLPAFDAVAYPQMAPPHSVRRAI